MSLRHPMPTCVQHFIGGEVVKGMIVSVALVPLPVIGVPKRVEVLGPEVKNGDSEPKDVSLRVHQSGFHLLGGTA